MKRSIIISVILTAILLSGVVTAVNTRVAPAQLSGCGAVERCCSCEKCECETCCAKEGCTCEDCQCECRAKDKCPKKCK